MCYIELEEIIYTSIIFKILEIIKFKCNVEISKCRNCWEYYWKFQICHIFVICYIVICRWPLCCRFSHSHTSDEIIFFRKLRRSRRKKERSSFQLHLITHTSSKNVRGQRICFSSKSWKTWRRRWGIMLLPPFTFRI